MALSILTAVICRLPHLNLNALDLKIIPKFNGIRLTLPALSWRRIKTSACGDYLLWLINQMSFDHVMSLLF